MSSPARSVLNSYGKETKVEKFTKPLRGFLGGRKVKTETTGKGKKIFKVYERVLVGLILVTVFPYTIVAGVVLACSSPKKVSSLQVANKPVSVPSKNAIKQAFNGGSVDPVVEPDLAATPTNEYDALRDFIECYISGIIDSSYDFEAFHKKSLAFIDFRLKNFDDKDAVVQFVDEVFKNADFRNNPKEFIELWDNKIKSDKQYTGNSFEAMNAIKQSFNGGSLDPVVKPDLAATPTNALRDFISYDFEAFHKEALAFIDFRLKNFADKDAVVQFVDEVFKNADFRDNPKEFIQRWKDELVKENTYSGISYEAMNALNQHQF